MAHEACRGGLLLLEDKSPVHADMSDASLADGNALSWERVAGIKAQNLKVNVHNSGYKKRSQ
ncbi:MAG TPA: hypothetical protein VFP10_02240 [Candidatus Eisenbacteria bacterium]|nr:hypothetical protein [Candidatus Eisenbacteria bacterium]